VVASIVAIDLFYARDGFRDVAEDQEPFPSGQVIAQAGVLDENRATRGQVTGAAIAEPAGPERPVDWLRTPELGARPPEVPLVAGYRARDTRPILSRQP